MALVATTLNGAITASQTTIRLTSGSGVAKNYQLLVGSEIMRVTDDQNTPQFEVIRGYQSTTAMAQGDKTFVIAGTMADFPVRQPNQSVPRWIEYSMGAAGAITIPDSQNAIINLNTGAASAMTLASPTYAQEGMELVIIARSAHAYTVDNTAFLGEADGNNLATYGGAIGDMMTIMAQGGSWVVTGVANVTFS